MVMTYNVSLLGIKNCIEHDVRFGKRILVPSDLGETFDYLPCWDGSLSRNGLGHLGQRSVL